MKTTALLVIALLMLTATWGCAAPARGDATETLRNGPTRSETPRLTFLPPEVSRSLKIAQVPTNRPVPLLVGTYWNCETDANTDLEICDLTTVVCTNNQEHCVQLP